MILGTQDKEFFPKDLTEKFKIARVFSQLSSIYGLSRPSASM